MTSKTLLSNSFVTKRSEQEKYLKNYMKVLLTQLPINLWMKEIRKITHLEN